MEHFLVLDSTGQAMAIRRLAADGWSPWTVAAATGLCVESVLLALQRAGARVH
jgi:hypothetical protein